MTKIKEFKQDLEALSRQYWGKDFKILSAQQGNEYEIIILTPVR